MSYLEENKYFLQSFFSGLRNLDMDSKRAEYESSKIKIRTKTSDYYQKIDIDDIDQTLALKTSFYEELVEVFGQYDFEYILMNLFLEKDFIKLFQSLEKDETFNSLLEKSKTSLALFIIGFKRTLNSALSIERRFSNNLKNIFYDCLPTDNYTWDETNYNNTSSINHKYAEYLIERITLDSPPWQSIIYNHLFFIKAYNHLDYFYRDKSTKSIFLINRIIEYYELMKVNHDVKLGQLVDRINNEIHSNCFVSYTKTPVCMSESTAKNMSTVLASKIEEFKTLLNIRTSDTYYNLYKLSDGISYDELNNYLNKKISAGYFISEDDIQNIEDDSRSNSDMNKAKDLILRKFYVFEKIELRK